MMGAGAEVVSNWVKKHEEEVIFRFFLEGPAESIFKKNLGSDLLNENNLRIDDFTNLNDILICGTSWQSSLEKKFFRKAKSQKKRVIAILDHWVNYKERFIIDESTLVLPDEIWVCDDYAYKIAKSIFSHSIIKKIENPYIQSIKEQIILLNKSISIDSKENILYVCEPIRDHAKLQFGDENYHGYSEESALKFFLNNVDFLRMTHKNVIVRPHPSESREKYNWVFDYYNDQISIGGVKDLIEEILCSSVIVGCESMAMVIGLLANKK